MTTDLDNFHATVEHRRPGRILYYFSCTPDLQERLTQHAGTADLAAHYHMAETNYVGIPRPADLPPIDYSSYWENEELPEGTTINAIGVAQVPSGYYHFWGYISPLRNATSLAEIENYPLEDPSQWDTSSMSATVEAMHAAGKYATAGIGHIYETAWQIRGYEQFLMDLIDRPAWAQCLFDRIAEQQMIRVVACAQAGADILRCGDDIANQNAMMFAPDTWRKMLLPRWRDIWAAGKAAHPGVKVWYHSDGNITDVVPDLIEASVDVLNPVQPECLDTDALHKRFGSRLVLDGCIGTQTTMPFGSPADVRARVKEVIEKYGTNGGLMVSPTHVLEPEVPIANIEAMVDACREFGTFE